MEYDKDKVDELILALFMSLSIIVCHLFRLLVPFRTQKSAIPLVISQMEFPIAPFGKV